MDDHDPIAQAREDEREHLQALVRDPRHITPVVWRERPYVQLLTGERQRLPSVPGLDLYAEDHGGRSAIMPVLDWIGQRPTLWYSRAGVDGQRLYPQVRPAKSRELGLIDVPDGFEAAPARHVHVETYEHRHLSDAEEFKTPRGKIVRGRWGVDLARHFGLTWEEGEAGAFTNEQLTHDGRAYEFHEHPMNWGPHLDNPDKLHEHRDLDVWGLDEHVHARRPKYRYLRDSGPDMHKVDVHPLARPLLQRGGDVAWWAFEGVLKADAILSDGADADGMPTRAVFGTGSVSVWRDPDRVARERLYAWLRLFRLVVIVPDSDWQRPGVGKRRDVSVSRYVERALDELKGEGIEAVAAAPLSGCGLLRCPGRRVEGHDEDCKVGVDDFLRDRGDLGDMLVQFDREPPQFAKDPRAQRNMDRIERLLLEWSSGPTFPVRFGYKAVGERLKLDPTTVRDNVLRLQALGRLEVVPVDHYHGPMQFGNVPAHVRPTPAALARREDGYAVTLRAYAAGKGIDL